MQRVEIDDFEDSRLDDYRNLKDGQLAAVRGRFIVEGVGNLRVLLGRSAHRPDSLLLSERRFAALAPELETLAPDCPIYVAPQALLDRVVGFPIHRGCLAVCARPPLEAAPDLARRVLETERAPRLILLEGVLDHDNVGGIFRNAMALGGRAVLLCPRTSDPLYRKAIRTSMGGTLCVPFARFDDLVEGISALRGLGYEVWAFDPAEPGQSLADAAAGRRGPVVLLLGTEGAGLTDRALAHADRRVRIEMEPGVDSLNVAAAAGIGLFATQSRDRRVPPTTRALGPQAPGGRATGEEGEEEAE